MNSLFFKGSFVFGCKSINIILKCNAMFIRFLRKNYGSRSKKGEIPRFELSHNALNRKPQK